MLAALTATVAAPARASADVSAPTITSASFVGTSVTAGSPLALRFVAQDDVGVMDVTATATGPGGITVTLLGPGGDAPGVIGAGGPISGVVPRGAPAGSYSLTRITVYDAAGNYTDYTPGAAVSSPGGSTTTLDLASIAVSVAQPGVADGAAPALGTFQDVSPYDDHRLGEFVTWSFTASDASPIAEVKVLVRRPDATTTSTVRGGGNLTAGKISLWIPPGEQTGTWTVTGVMLTDSAGNSDIYPFDGAPRPALTFAVVTGEPRPDTTRVFDTRPDPTVVTKAPTVPVAIGSSITVSGSVTFLKTAVPYPVLALYRTSGGTSTFMRLIIGTSAGAFSTRVTVQATARYQVRFLGSDLAVAPAPSLMGTAQLVRAGVKQTLTVAATTVTVPAGRSGTLVVTLSPRRAGATVTLKKWNGSWWAAVGSVQTRSDGKASVSVPRPSTSALYRWTIAYDGVRLAATSAKVTVRRG